MADDKSDKAGVSPNHDELPASLRALVDSAGRSAAIPHFYFNGFVMAQGTGDVTFILQLNNQPVAAANCSFTVAKTLAKNLEQGISKLEGLAGREIMTVDEIARLLAQQKK